MLKGLTLVLPRGTTTAVVGRSGAGKSTVAALLSRFYSPDSGGTMAAVTACSSMLWQPGFIQGVLRCNQA